MPSEMYNLTWVFIEKKKKFSSISWWADSSFQITSALRRPIKYLIPGFVCKTLLSLEDGRYLSVFTLWAQIWIAFLVSNSILVTKSLQFKGNWHRTQSGVTIKYLDQHTFDETLSIFFINL